MYQKLAVRVNSWKNARALEVMGREASLEIVLHGCACDVCDERFEWLCRKLDDEKVEYEVELRKEGRSREKAGQVVKQEEHFASSKWIVVPLPEAFTEDEKTAVEWVRWKLGLRRMELVV